MKLRDLGKTIDKLIKVDPHLEDQLKPIKTKWKRWPAKTENYWQELLSILNSDPLMDHPKRNEMRDILNSKNSSSKKAIYSFEEVLPNDHIIGVIPENLADLIRNHDLKSIRIAKLHVEANITRNFDLLKKTNREESLLELNSKKIWAKIKDHFDLWLRPAQYSIKSKIGLLYLTEQNPLPQFIGNGMVKMDTDTLKNFFKFLNIEPPPGLLDE